MKTNVLLLCIAGMAGWTGMVFGQRGQLSLPGGDSPLPPQLAAGQECATSIARPATASPAKATARRRLALPQATSLQLGLFKIKSTPASVLPTDEDLLQTVTRRMPGSSMPSFTC